MTNPAAGLNSSLEHADVVVRGRPSAFLQEVSVGKHRFQADEPFSIGGSDAAPDPYDYLLAALGACTSMTIGMYARRSKWPLDDVVVGLRHSRIHAEDCADCETKSGMLDRIEVDIQLIGDLTPAQREKLMHIAHKCPVHRTLKSEIAIAVREETEALPATTPAATN
ncbi:hypothetical protein BH18VER1_BH18VER1_22130 [soil metagenome]